MVVTGEEEKMEKSVEWSGGGDPDLDQPRRGGVPGSVESGGGRRRAGPRGARC